MSYRYYQGLLVCTPTADRKVAFHLSSLGERETIFHPSMQDETIFYPWMKDESSMKRVV